jgi:putative restriction endonuclease
VSSAVFTASESSAYDDEIESRYHFPDRYLNQVQAAIGHYIIYYEPRRNAGPSSSGGRQAYFALARVTAVEADRSTPGHHYAHMADFMEFDRPVPFREGARYYESLLRRSDGQTSRGAFGRSVRSIPPHEFNLILQAGFSLAPEPWDRLSDPQSLVADSRGQLLLAEDVPEYVARSTVAQIINRKFRDIAFRRHVRNAYQNTCAVTGLRLINGGGRPEVQAAHIRPVEHDGPDTVRNGIALTGTAHWLFDRGLISFSDDYRILLSPHGVPDDLDRLIRKERSLIVPSEAARRPHATYLRWHREHRFKN